MEIDPEIVVVIMAGGLGKRMQSELPKVLHRIRGLPMIVHVLLSVKQIARPIAQIFVVVGKYRRRIESIVYKYIDSHKICFIEQPEALGTGHAMQCCRDDLLAYSPTTPVLILSGDVPLITPATMEKMLDHLKGIRVLTTRLSEPRGYGRILTGPNCAFLRIVEEKDATEEERAVTLVNGGVYAVNCGLLCRYLPHLQNHNEQREYYLTDIVEIIQRNEEARGGEGVVEQMEIPVHRQREIMGVNTPDDLERIHQFYRPFCAG